MSTLLQRTAAALGEQADLRYDYSQIDEAHRTAVRDAAVEIKRREKRAVTDIIEIGQTLIGVRDRLPNRQFAPWIEQEFGWQRSMAYNFIAVAENRPKFGQIENFGLSALYLLSSPSAPEEAVIEANRLADSGERVTHKTAKALVEIHRPADRPKPANASSATVPLNRVVGKCGVCGRALTDPNSVGKACGPECSKKLAAQGGPDAAAADQPDTFAEEMQIPHGARFVPAVEPASIKPVKSRQYDPCPFCGSGRLGNEMEHIKKRHRVNCDNCGACGPWGDTVVEALTLWNVRAS